MKKIIMMVMIAMVAVTGVQAKETDYTRSIQDADRLLCKFIYHGMKIEGANKYNIVRMNDVEEILSGYNVSNNGKTIKGDKVTFKYVGALRDDVGMIYRDDEKKATFELMNRKSKNDNKMYDAHMYLDEPAYKVAGHCMTTTEVK